MKLFLVVLEGVPVEFERHSPFCATRFPNTGVVPTNPVAGVLPPRTRRGTRRMFLCHATVRKNGKTHISFRLVRSVRRGRKVIQETIAHLGQPDAEGRAKGSALAKHFLGKRAKGPSLFEDMKPVATERAELGHIPVERLRAFGNVWIGLTVWQALGLDQLCEAALPSGRETIAWATMAAILVIARLCEPSSELHDARTAL